MKPEPVLLARIHSFDCPCRSCSALTSGVRMTRRPPTLMQRFRRAAEPGDWAAIIIGAQLGVALITILVIANEWDVVASALAALW